MSFEIFFTSALTGAIVAGISHWLDRRARRREMLFNLAFKLAQDRTNLVLEIAMKDGKPASFKDTVFLAEEYLSWIDHLYKNGNLPHEAYLRGTEKAKKE